MAREQQAWENYRRGGESSSTNDTLLVGPKKRQFSEKGSESKGDNHHATGISDRLGKGAVLDAGGHHRSKDVIVIRKTRILAGASRSDIWTIDIYGRP